MKLTESLGGIGLSANLSDAISGQPFAALASKCGNGGAKLEGGQKFYSRDQYFVNEVIWHLFKSDHVRSVQYRARKQAAVS